MKFFVKGSNVSLILRIALASVFLYAAISSFISPNDWIGYMPKFMRGFVPDDLLLAGFSVFEIALSVWLLSGLYVRYAALLSAALLGGIVVLNPALLPITFRDIGLFIAALALYAEHTKPATDLH
ncbi:MAG TPA: DoxX family membrane protein [Candidatus Saccharimonadales bacterium]|nr:DoxX family membrane protein [Candidatus Saccharimonadales bacterium]